MARALRENGYAKAVEADLEEARALQVTGVPFFLFDRRYAVAGAQPADVFTQTLTQVERRGPFRSASVPADIS